VNRAGTRGCRITLALIVAGVAAGCSSSGEKEIPDYFSARIVPALQVPADLDAPYRSAADFYDV